MHTLKSLAIAAAASLALGGIWGAQFMRFSAEQNAGQQVFFIQGAPVVLADGGTVRVMIGPAETAPEKNQRINFYLRVQNLSNQPITISEDQIKAARTDGQEIRIWKAIDVRRDIAKRADASRFAARMAAALDGFAAGYANEDRDIGLSNLELRERINRANSREELETAMSGLFLERETIFPGQYFFGFVQIDPPDGKGRETAFKFLTIFGNDQIPLEFLYVPAK